jgi:hypothetical protein
MNSKKTKIIIAMNASKLVSLSHSHSKVFSVYFTLTGCFGTSIAQVIDTVVADQKNYKKKKTMKRNEKAIRFC